MRMKMKYVAYYRVSTSKQGESGLGLAAQQAIVNQYINKEDIIASFTDIKSGKTLEREGLEEAIQLAIKEKATLVVAKHDRLSRNVVDALTTLERLVQNGASLVCLDLPSNTDKFTLTIMFAVAERERELISIRTKNALAEKKKRGERLGRKPLGALKKIYIPKKDAMTPIEKGKLGGKKARENQLPLYLEKITPVINLIKLFRASNPEATDAQLVAYLNQINYPTLSGRGRWHQSSILRLKKYYK